MTDTSTTEPSPFTTLPPDQHPGGVLPDGVMYVTPAEMGYLKSMSWGPDAWRTTCEQCGSELIFERHPADWPNHPGELGTLRVKIECNVCAHQQYTDGGTEVEFVAARTRELYAQIAAEVARRLQSENGGTHVTVESVTAGDHGTGGDLAPGQ